LAPFFARLASKFENPKNYYDLKHFFLKKPKKVSKNAEFHADIKFVEKVFKFFFWVILVLFSNFEASPHFKIIIQNMLSIRGTNSIAG
jgi:hypothetical protein